MTDHKSDNDNEITPPSEKDSLRSSSSNRQTGVTTYVICIPEGSKTPKLKYGSIRKIDIEDEVHQIIKHIEDIELQTVEIVNNINNISISCSKCFSGLNILSRNKTKAKANGNTVKVI